MNKQYEVRKNVTLKKSINYEVQCKIHMTFSYTVLKKKNPPKQNADSSKQVFSPANLHCLSGQPSFSPFLQPRETSFLVRALW